MWRVLGFCKEEVRSMIIGRYYADGSPVEEVNLRDKGRMFELEVCVIKHPRRYPRYNVDYCSLAFCETKESAEEMMKGFLKEDGDWKKDLYCFYIYERVLGVRFDRSEYMACWLYNEAGQEIDRRLFPSYYSEDGFEGRNANEVRFKFGDIAELYDGDTVSLVHVLAPPREREFYIRRTEEDGAPYRGDISDDTYIILKDYPHYFGGHMHVDALSLFKPHFEIPKSAKNRLDKIWEGYQEDRRECYGDNPNDCQI